MQEREWDLWLERLVIDAVGDPSVLVGDRAPAENRHGLDGPVAVGVHRIDRARVDQALVDPLVPEVEAVAETLAGPYTVDEHVLAHHRPSFEPPLRRWAARRALRADPGRLDELLRSARTFEPRHRDALVHGLLDAADGIDEARRRDLIRGGLDSAQASVRRTALDRLCQLDGPEAASHRARADTNAAVRKWTPRQEELTTPSLLAS